jgi:hypothetical protein
MQVDTKNMMDGFDYQAAMKHLKTDATDRASVVKNLSLQLLDVNSPLKILEIYEREYMTKQPEVFPEELFMLLYFFKTQVRDLADVSATHLVKTDFRLQALVDQIMKTYTPNIDFAYQISTILSLTTLMSFYEFNVTDSWKDKLVESL